MELSIVVPTLNGRDRLGDCLDSLSEHAPDAEVVVVNGPSADGTTGMVKERPDVDTLVEISERNVNVARNAGIAVASNDVVAIVSYDREIDPSWEPTVRRSLEDGFDAVTGPTRTPYGRDRERTRSVAGRTVTYCNGENMAFRRSTIEALDGFDEYLTIGGTRDLSHRLTAMEFDLDWQPAMSVHSAVGADGGAIDHDRRELYRAHAYQLAKNYGISPRAAVKGLFDAGKDAVGAAVGVVRGDADPSGWLANGRGAVVGLTTGSVHGLRARYRDRTLRRNPNGLSARQNRAVCRYDW